MSEGVSEGIRYVRGCVRGYESKVCQKVCVMLLPGASPEDIDMEAMARPRPTHPGRNKRGTTAESQREGISEVSGGSGGYWETYTPWEEQQQQ